MITILDFGCEGSDLVSQGRQRDLELCQREGGEIFWRGKKSLTRQTVAASGHSSLVFHTVVT